jgi:4-hydroxy-3-methylbut-2-enyl diphosphate reductase
MKINVAKYAGFCFGVKRALDIALKTPKSNRRVYMLGDIVHNEDVVRTIKKAGIKKIKKLNRGRNRTLLIRAHGVSLAILEKAKSLGYRIIDATCPMVKEIHRIAWEMERKGYKIIIIGDKRHEEVQGIIGQLKNKARVIDPLPMHRRGVDRIPHLPFKAIQRIKKACVLVQSTQNLEKVLEIVRVLKLYIKELKFFNTICRPTRIKQGEIKNMPLENDVMIIIGSKTSANTRRLYEISKSLNKRSYWISSRKEIKPAWFKGAENAGITSGASTPDSTTKEIVAYIKKLT